jgi:molybdopterin/thiamine biosynthesis adenylyltransferase
MSERYLRHSLIDWFDQDLIRSRHVLVVGAGAIGNEVIKNLVLLGVGSIHIVDFDVIEIHNLTRSVLFTEDDVGSPKAQVAATAARKLDPNCTITAVHGDFWSEISFDDVHRADVVFCCVDNFEARVRINQLCSLIRTDFINTGIDSRYVVAEFFPFSNEAASPCYECELPPSAYQRMAERFSCGWLKKVAFKERKIPTTVVTASYAGAFATSLFLYSYRADAEKNARRIFFDTVSSVSSKINIQKNAGCPCCGTKSDKSIILKAARDIDSFLELHAESDVTVTSSDPILVEWSAPNCAACATTPSVVIFKRASEFNESSTICGTCNLPQRLPVVRDQFSVRELRERFKGQTFPSKFLSWEIEGTQFIVELMEGIDDGRDKCLY